MKQLIAEDILEKFKETTGIKATWRPIKKTDLYDRVDGVVNIAMGKEKLELPAEAKNTIVNVNLPSFLNTLNVNHKFLVLAETIPPKIREELKKMGVHYIDKAGNASIIQDNIFIYLEGHKLQKSEKDKKVKVFSKSGLRVIFQFLIDPDLMNDTIRNIANVTGVSLDTAHKTITGLKQAGYLLQVSENKLGWAKRKELLEKWIEEFEIRLKPALHISNFRFLKEDDFLNWKKLNFRNGKSRWGGEPGAELFTGFIKPATLTIYTSETRNDLIKNYRFLPDPNGYIKVYEKFWKKDTVNDNVAPPLLVYADLINTGNKRNIEAAQKIYEQLLQGQF